MFRDFRSPAPKSTSRRSAGPSVPAQRLLRLHLPRSWRVPRMRLRALTALLLALGSSTAHAQVAAINGERFTPNANGKGFFAAESADTLEAMTPYVGLWLNYARDPMRVMGARSSQLAQRLTFDLQLAVGLTRWLEVGVAAPLVLVNEKGSAPGASGGVVGPGPMRVELKLRALNEVDHGVGLAFQFGLGFAVAYADQFLSENGVTFSPALLIEKRFSENFRFLLNFG